MFHARSLFLLSALAGLVVSGCHSGPSGTYTDGTGTVILELKGGGSANFTFLNQVQDCSYSSSGTQLTLTCKGDATGPTVFTIHDDGTLTGPPGSFMPPLRKEK